MMQGFLFNLVRIGGRAVGMRGVSRLGQARFVAGLVALHLLPVATLQAEGDTNTFLQLVPTAEVDSSGILLSQVAARSDEKPLPALRILDAPAFGQTTRLTRAALSNALVEADSDLATLPFGGADQVKITRLATNLDETALRELLTTVLQDQYVKDRGKLELRFTRPWTPLSVPEESLQVKVLSLPALGVTSSFIIRFELCCGDESLGTWQMAMRARIMRDVWVASEPMRRGEPLTHDRLELEPRDMLMVREPLFEWDANGIQLDVAYSVQSGAILYARQVCAHPVVHRGQAANAVLQDGALSVSLKVEVLEDGAPGDFIRVRNPQTRRELRAQVIHENLLAIPI